VCCGLMVGQGIWDAIEVTVVYDMKETLFLLTDLRTWMCNWISLGESIARFWIRYVYILRNTFGTVLSQYCIAP
jgi:hypothetical protein